MRKIRKLAKSEEIPQNMQESIRLATFDQYRGLLFSIAYRMLGTVSDAEDMMQETFLRWHTSREEEIKDPRAYLVTILSRLCIIICNPLAFNERNTPARGFPSR